MHHSFSNPNLLESYDDQLSSIIRLIQKYTCNSKHTSGTAFVIRLTDNYHSKYFIDLIYKYSSSKNLYFQFRHIPENCEVVFRLDKISLK